MTVAAESGGFEQPGSEVLRATLTLDAQGREEVSRIAREALERARAVNAQVADRRADGDEPLATTELTILHFERRA